MKLKEYRAKRNIEQSGEPAAEVKKTGKRRFVVQEHHARNLHYDFRIEMGGVLRSWAVPKGPPLEPGIRRLAVRVDDHPVGYVDFEGVIPGGQYGAGQVAIWDRGTYALKYDGKDKIEIIMRGEKMRGQYTLVQTHNNPKNWLLMKLKAKQ